MKRLVSDEDFNGPLLSGLLQADPTIDVVRVVDATLGGTPDKPILAWAARNGRIIVSDDRRTMAPDAARRIASGRMIQGLIIVSRTCARKQAIEDIRIALECYEDEGWENRIVTIPL